MPRLTERELLDDLAAVEEENDDAADLISFEERVDRLRRGALRPFPQQQSTRRVTTQPVGRLLRREASR